MTPIRPPLAGTAFRGVRVQSVVMKFIARIAATLSAVIMLVGLSYGREISKGVAGIILEDGKPVASGFVAGSKRLVITCAHVVQEGRQYTYAGVGMKRAVALILEQTLDTHDLAWFSTSSDLVKTPLVLGDFHKVRPRDVIFYRGWRQGGSQYVLDQTRVRATGQLAHRGATVHYLEFLGVAKPGFSGGPVFNKDLEVVALVTLAFAHKPHGVTRVEPMTQAFSIEVLRAILAQRVDFEKLKPQEETVVIVLPPETVTSPALKPMFGKATEGGCRSALEGACQDRPGGATLAHHVFVTANRDCYGACDDGHPVRAVFFDQ